VLPQNNNSAVTVANGITTVTRFNTVSCLNDCHDKSIKTAS
jgi:hypothetical protein